MAWIELHDTLPDHPKTIMSSAALGIDKDMLVGKLTRLWTWSINHRENGFIADYEMQTVAEVMRWTKKPEQLFSALCKAPPNCCAGFFERVDGGYVIHGWDERVSMLRDARERTRAETRKRVAAHREKKRALQATEIDQDVTECNALHSSYVTPKVTQSNAATVPNRTLEEDEDERARKDDENDRGILGSCDCGDSEPDGDRVDDLITYCQTNLPAMNGKSYEELVDYMRDGITPDMVRYAVDETRAHNSMAWSYASSIMNSWALNNIKNLDAARVHSAQYRARGHPRGHQPDRNTADDSAPALRIVD